MKPQSLKLGMAFGFFLIIIAIFLTPGLNSAQDQISSQPTLKLTLCIVGETEACQPAGYKSYNLDEPSNCATLTPDDIDDWIMDNRAYQCKPVPPPVIKLDARFLEALQICQNQNPKAKKPAERKSMVLMLEFANPQSSEVTIQRIASPEYTEIPSRTWKGKMDNEFRLIYHERADAFYPGYNIKWSIRVGGKEWKIKTGG